jgi:hypothetical protein
MIGLMLVALLIAYLPTIYGAFSRREAVVAQLEVRAGSPPSAVDMILRFHRLHHMDTLAGLWEPWEIWFLDIEETHTSIGAVSFFRSPQSDRSWVTAAGAILDCAAIRLSTLDLPTDPRPALCLRAGYIALRRLADFFRMPYDPNPRPDDPISVEQGEFDEAYDRLKAAGVPVKPDRAQCWRDFAGWRVNYDTVLLELASLLMVPAAPWSSDRSPAFRRPSLFSWASGQPVRPPGTRPAARVPASEDSAIAYVEKPLPAALPSAVTPPTAVPPATSTTLPGLDTLPAATRDAFGDG